MKRAVQVRSEERQLHACLPSHLQPLLEDKQLLIWKEILVDLQYPDSKIVDDVKSVYKQLGVEVQHSERLRIAVEKPGGGVAFLKVLALPSGAAGSVSAFLEPHQQFHS